MHEKEIQEREEEKAARELERRRTSYREFCEAHGRPKTRREFLEACAIGFGGYVMLPTTSSLLFTPEAWAQSGECPAPVPANDPNRLSPIVSISLGGGAMLSGNMVPMGQDGNPLPSYDKMGLGRSPNLVSRFGGARFFERSQLLAGIESVTTQATRDNTAAVMIAVRSGDDSRNNRMNIAGLTAAAGLTGEVLPDLGSSRHMDAFVSSASPLQVRRFGDLANAASGGGSGALAVLSREQRASLQNTILQLNEEQALTLAQRGRGDVAGFLARCASQQNYQNATAEPPPIDVRQTPALAAAWGVDAGTGDGDREVVFGSMLLASLRGSAGHAMFEIGGYDYHNNTRTRGDERDFEAGELIGRTLETAALTGQKVFIYVSSDGACVSPTSDADDAPWRSDRGSAGSMQLYAYDPAGRPNLANGWQVGWFNDAQAADTSVIGGAESGAAAAFLNYMAFNDKLNIGQNLVSNVFQPSDIERVVKFGA